MTSIIQASIGPSTLEKSIGNVAKADKTVCPRRCLKLKVPAYKSSREMLPLELR